MKNLATLFLLGCSSLFTYAQNPVGNANLVVYTEQGEPFILKLNGVQKNEQAQSNVKLTSLPLPKYQMIVDFTDNTLADINKDVYLQPGYEIVYSIKKNNKGEYVVRPQSQVAIMQQYPSNTMPNTATAPANNNVTYTQTNTRPTTTVTTSTYPNTNTNVTYSQTTTMPNNNVTYSQTTTQPGTTYTQTTTTTQTNPNANMNVNMSTPVGVNVNVNVSDPLLTGTTTYSQTTTTTSTTGYNNATTTSTGYTRCTYPMSGSDFTNAYNSIQSKSFDETKLTVAKQVMSSNCLTTAQVKQIMLLFSFEETRLDLAKYAYGYTYDPNNYYQLNDAFTFSSSTDALNSYISGFGR